MRRCGVATNGSIARARSGSQNGMRHAHARRSRPRASRVQHVDVALDERRLGDDADGVPILGADLEAPARQPIRRLERLVAVGDAAEHDELALPRLLRRTPRARSSGARGFTTIFRSKSVPAPKLRYSCAGPRVAVVADDAVRDEVAGPRRDVVHRQDDIHRLDGDDTQRRCSLDRATFDVALSRNRRLRDVEEPHALMESADESDVRCDRAPRWRLDDVVEAKGLEATCDLR